MPPDNEIQRYYALLKDRVAALEREHRALEAWLRDLSNGADVWAHHLDKRLDGLAERIGRLEDPGLASRLDTIEAAFPQLGDALQQLVQHADRRFNTLHQRIGRLELEADV